jgi:large subunit ribosomal protein L28
MSRECSVCGKKQQVGSQISHSHIRTKKRWRVNLQTVRAKTPQGTVQMKVCTRCLRSGKVIKAS